MNSTIQTIANDYLTVQINLKGAELWSIQDSSGTEYLWQGNPCYWSDRAITIFPYVARMTAGSYTLHGEKYEMAIHGFAKDMVFEVAEAQSDCITLQISHTEDTLKQYPFRFAFLVTYRLIDHKLITEYTVKSYDTHTMYFGIGGHPGFNVPLKDNLNFSDYYIEFCEESTPDRLIFSEDCFVLEGQTTPFALQDELRYHLHHDMFDEDAIIMTNMPKQVTLGSHKDPGKIRVTYPDMPYLGIWHMPKTDAPYICIEPWSSLPSRKDVVEELSEQNDLVSLPAGETYVNTWSIEIL